MANWLNEWLLCTVLSALISSHSWCLVMPYEKIQRKITYNSYNKIELGPFTWDISASVTVLQSAPQSSGSISIKKYDCLNLTLQPVCNSQDLFWHSEMKIYLQRNKFLSRCDCRRVTSFFLQWITKCPLPAYRLCLYSILLLYQMHKDWHLSTRSKLIAVFRDVSLLFRDGLVWLFSAGAGISISMWYQQFELRFSHS
jgi:hypothetical protein